MHRGTVAVCDDCIRIPYIPEAKIGGEYMVRIWSSGAGSYSTQTNIRHYRNKDGTEMLQAALRCNFEAHLREIPHYVKGRDWYGRGWGQSQPTFELWIRVQPRWVVQAVFNQIRTERNERTVEGLTRLKGKPRKDWTYNDHEDWHRAMGTLH